MLDGYGWAFEPGGIEAVGEIRLFLPGEGSLNFDIQIIAFFIMQYHLLNTVGADIYKTYGGEIDFTVKALSDFFTPPILLPSFNTIPGPYSCVFHMGISSKSGYAPGLSFPENRGDRFPNQAGE